MLPPSVDIEILIPLPVALLVHVSVILSGLVNTAWTLLGAAMAPLPPMVLALATLENVESPVVL